MTTIGPLQIEANAEDGVEVNNSWYVDGLYGNGIYLGTDGAPFFGGFSWLGIVIPPQSNIVSCSVRLYPNTARTGTTDTELRFVDSSDAPQWSSGNRPTQLQKTTTFTEWTTVFADTWIDLPDLSAELQEVVNNNAGVSGRLSLSIGGIGSAWGLYTTVYDYSIDPLLTAEITIVYAGPDDGIELYKPSWPTELLHRAAWRKPDEFTPGIFESRILSSRTIRGVK